MQLLLTCCFTTLRALPPSTNFFTFLAFSVKFFYSLDDIVGGSVASPFNVSPKPWWTNTVHITQNRWTHWIYQYQTILGCFFHIAYFSQFLNILITYVAFHAKSSTSWFSKFSMSHTTYKTQHVYVHQPTPTCFIDLRSNEYLSIKFTRYEHETLIDSK